MFALTGSFTEFEQLQNFTAWPASLLKMSGTRCWSRWSRRKISGAASMRTTRGAKPGAVWRKSRLGRAIERYLQNDLVRGLVFTDAKIGVFTHPHDETLLQNRCFLYHLIGNKTGEWKVPVGGMGAVARELERAARQRGAEMFTRVNRSRSRCHGKKAKRRV